MAFSTLRLSLRRFRLRLYLALLVRQLMPTVYQTFRVSLLGTLPPDTGAISIASQMQWVNVLLEITEEGLLQPLYHCLGSTLADAGATRNKVRTGFVVCLAVYSAFSAFTSSLAGPLVSWMGQSEALHDETVHYIRLELAGIVASSLAKFLMLVMVMKEWDAALYATLAVQMVCSVTLDYVLLVVADLGTDGVAYSSIGTALVVLALSLAICWRKLGMRCNSSSSDEDKKWQWGWMRRWTRVGGFSALDSLVRNAVYIVVVVRAMNLLEEQDSYWVTNTFIWSWLLLPALPLAETLKQDAANSAKGPPLPHWRKTAAYFFIAALIFAGWACLYPAWYPFIEHVLQAAKPDVVMALALQLAPCYAVFVVGSLMSAVFCALGRTELLLLSSFIVNLLLVALFLLMTYGILPNTVEVVAGIFGCGLVLGAVVTAGIYAWLVKKHPLL